MGEKPLIHRKDNSQLHFGHKASGQDWREVCGEIRSSPSRRAGGRAEQESLVCWAGVEPETFFLGPGGGGTHSATPNPFPGGLEGQFEIPKIFSKLGRKQRTPLPPGEFPLSPNPP